MKWEWRGEYRRCQPCKSKAETCICGNRGNCAACFRKKQANAVPLDADFRHYGVYDFDKYPPSPYLWMEEYGTLSLENLGA
jgi:hypothetical protein